ncbi:MAG: chitobiase/beta-hexosaminidase C-terminal domain-containing protein [Kiritimatiellae bacterium]|nr:chitobiase/beta-hexosaminidase C-terminal domain-containing protein [Kiritimatiellia bacterium]
MKEMIKMVLAAAMACGAEAWGQAALPAVRVDTRAARLAALLATGVERVGASDGGTPIEWDTTQVEDGWWRVSVDDGALGITRPTAGDDGALGITRPTVDVLVLNGPSVVGGRMSKGEAWDDGRVVVVRHDVVVPSGLTLTLGAGCVVKFTEGSRIVGEDGGAVEAEGAYLAAFDDDSVGGDTDMNGAAEGGALGTTRPTSWWLDDPAVAELAMVKFVDGATNLPTRTYTAGKAYGALPDLARDDAMFGGWRRVENGGLGQAALPEDVVAGGETILYAYWIPYELGIDPSSATVGASASEGMFAVAANSEWEVSCDADWVTVQGGRAAYPYAAAVTYAVSENASSDARTATIRVTMRRDGDNAPYQCDFTLTQAGMAQLSAPTVNPADGTTFVGSSRRVSVGGAETGAEIRYTLDGSEPTATSKLYTKSFNVFDTTVVKARAFKAGMLPSETVSVRIVRLQTLAEALDVPLWTVTTDGDAEWAVDENTGRNGSSCARSGAIGDEQESSLSTTVDGAGTLTFWWRADCEDDPDYDNWDYLAFSVDGTEVARIDGDSGWRQVSVKLKTDTAHTLTWTFCKDYTDDDMTGIEDCGWVDQVAWTPLVGDSEVPVAWLENLGMVAAGATAADAANADPDGDGLTPAEEYVAGTDPNDPDSTLRAYIEVVDGKPVIACVPDLLDERVYKVWGKKDLGDPDEPWVEVREGEEDLYNFFKVTVEMP